jgi:hypothetical protein
MDVIKDTIFTFYFMANEIVDASTNFTKDILTNNNVEPTIPY